MHVSLIARSQPFGTPTKVSSRAAAQWLQRRQNGNTRRTYDSSFNSFRKWMQSRSRSTDATDETDVVFYIRHLLETKHSSSGTVMVAISSIRDHFKYDREKSAMLSSTMVQDAVKIGKRDGKQAVKKKPLTVAMLEDMHAWYHDEQARSAVIRSHLVSWTDQRDLTLLIVMMTGFLRESELVRIKPKEVTFTQVTINGQVREVVEIYISRAKNDQAAQGHLLRIGDAPHSNLCPVFWMKLMSKRLRNTCSCYFFHSYEGFSLNRSTPCGIIQKWIERINTRNRSLPLKNQYGDPRSYGSHSCRIGGVTAAHAAGVDMELIRQHGNWKSDVVYEYIQPTITQQLAVTDFIQQ